MPAAGVVGGFDTEQPSTVKAAQQPRRQRVDLQVAAYNLDGLDTDNQHTMAQPIATTKAAQPQIVTAISRA